MGMASSQPLVYRLWAAARAAWWRPFLWRAGVLRKGREASAEFMAGTFGIAIDMAGGSTVAGVAVDCSKFRDHVPLTLLRNIAERAGLPEAVWRPMVAAYAFPRQVKADGLVGAPGAPSRGVAPGCPAATGSSEALRWPASWRQWGPRVAIALGQLAAAGQRGPAARVRPTRRRAPEPGAMMGRWVKGGGAFVGSCLVVRPARALVYCMRRSRALSSTVPSRPRRRRQWAPAWARAPCLEATQPALAATAGPGMALRNQ